MELPQKREIEIFRTLKGLKSCEFVVIGGYAVSSYTLPRFSVDCDIVAHRLDGKQIRLRLLSLGYQQKRDMHNMYKSSFERFEKTIPPGFAVSIDMLIDNVFDRQTNSSFSADWVFRHSNIQQLRGKTFKDRITARVIGIDALTVMKIVSCRAADIRDVFMLAPAVKDRQWLRAEVSERYDFMDRMARIKKSVTSKQFKDGFQGVFGRVDDSVFERHTRMLLQLAKE